MNYDYDNLYREHIYCSAPEVLLRSGEFVVRLDDCNVWESESDNYDLRGQLKYILER